RRTLADGIRPPSLGRPGRAPRLAATRRRPQHAAVRGFSRAAAPPPKGRGMKLRMLSADDKLAEIRRLYFSTTKQTIHDDLAKALDLLKSITSEQEREPATV